MSAAGDRVAVACARGQSLPAPTVPAVSGRPLGILLMRLRVAEINEHAIAHILAQPSLSDRCRLGEATFAAMVPKEEDAPVADLGSSCNRSGTPAALLARPCTLLTLSELSFTVGEVFFSFTVLRPH